MNGPPDKRRRATSSTLYFKPRHTHSVGSFFSYFTRKERGVHIDQYDMLCIQHITRIKKELLEGEISRKYKREREPTVRMKSIVSRSRV